MEAELIKSAKEDLQRRNKCQEAILFHDQVEKYHDNKDGHAPRIVVATDLEIAYYKGKTKAEFSRSFFWVDLLNFTYEEQEQKIVLQFKPDPNLNKPKLCRFASPKNGEYKDILANYLVRVLPPYLAESSGAKALSTSGKGNVPSSALSRLTAYAVSRNQEISAEIFTEVSNSIKYRQTSITIPGKNEQSVVLASLQNDPFAEEIVIKSVEGSDPFIVFSSLPGGYSPFKHVTIDSPALPTVIPMFSTLRRRSEHFHTDGLTLKNTKMDEKTIKALCKYITKSSAPEPEPAPEATPGTPPPSPTSPGKRTELLNFNSFNFDNAFQEDAMEGFYSSFFDGDFASTLQVFGLNHADKVDVEAICKKTNNAVALSFAYDNLEMSEAIRTICAADIPTLKAISLAGNKCMNPTSTVDVKVPEQIELIDISNSEFADGQLVLFLRFIFRGKFRNGITLLAEGIKAKEEETMRAIEYLGSLKHSPIVGLGWSTNKISGAFIKVLQTSKHLKTLYLNDCLAAEDETQIKLVADVLPKMKSLTKFMMRGGNKKCGASIIPILKALKEIHGLQWLDVSNQEIAANGLLAIREIVESTQLSFLSFDGAKPESQDPIESILTTAKDRGIPIRISYPVIDATALAMDEGKLITSLVVLSGESFEEYDPKDSFTLPFDVYVHQSNLEEQFPTYMSKKFVDELNQSADIEESSDSNKLVSPKKPGADPFDNDSFEDDQERVQKQQNYRNFYLGDDIDSSDSKSKENDDSNSKSDKLNDKLKIKEDGFVPPEWEDFHPDVLMTFDNTPAMQKLQKKYSLPVLREAIQ